MNIPLLNADLGEGYNFDEQMFPLLDVANIACGGHAGDEVSMILACQRAIQFKVQVGAHPSYPDREGFGRGKPDGPMQSLYSSLCSQIEIFENIAARQGLKSRHFKPHGQLYNDAAFDPEIAGLLLRVAKDFPHLSVYVLAGSPLVQWADQEDVYVVEEAFPDRRYQADGRLRPRRFADALIDDTRQVALQAECMVKGEPLMTAEGERLIVSAGTLCLHGDTPKALENARVVRRVLASVA